MLVALPRRVHRVNAVVSAPWDATRMLEAGSSDFNPLDSESSPGIRERFSPPTGF